MYFTETRNPYFSLKERPISPPPGTVTSNQPQLTTALPIPSLPSPLASNDSPISNVNTQPNPNLLGSNVNTGVGQGTIYRQPNPQGIAQLPSHNQPMVTQGMVSVGMVNAARGGIMGNTQFPNQTMQAPPGYHAATGMGGQGRPPNRWMLPPQSQQRPTFLPQGQQVTTTQGSALIAQLTQPPSSMPGPGVNQFGQMAGGAPMNPQQQQQLRMNILANQSTQQQNIQTSVPQNVQTSGIGQTPGIVSTGIAQPSTISQASNPSQGGPGGQVGQPAGPARERHTIWQGLLEWIEKPKNSNDPQKVTRHVPCQVSANAKDGEPELKAEGWPTKLIMQLMPKQLIGNIGGAYLKNSKSVLFHPQNCEALDSLTKVMSTGFAGCVHFTSVQSPPCDIKVLILLYTAEKRAYLGFIPNDQAAFVDRLRKVIQQQKSTQMLRQGQGGATGSNMNPQAVGSSPMGGNVGTPPQLPVSNTPTSQATAQQQGLMMSQTNTMAMGGGQITQNIVTSSPSGTGIGVLGQSVPTGMQPRIRMQGIPQATSPQVNQSGGNPSAMAPGMMGAPLQRAPFDNNLEAARLQNLEKINQLKQTLEAAQQQEQQYKSQLERISHMKTSQLQEALQIAQQQEMQYKILDQQRVAANQAGPQGPNAQQQQRMMRPMMNTNNPGLRHLLQQQPQYRQQLMGMQAGISGSGPRPQMGQQMPNNPGSNPQQSFDDVGNFDFM